MTQFTSLRISNIDKLNSNAVAITLDHADANFQWEAGQFLTIEAEINGEMVRRSYSICTPPHSKRLTIGVKKVEGGKMSNYLCDNTGEGDQLRVMPPEGNFLLPSSAEEYVFFAAGSGITPILSQIGHLLADVDKPKVTLIFSNRSTDEAMFLDQVRKWSDQSDISVLEIYSDGTTGIPLTSGRVDFSKTLEILRTKVHSPTTAQYFICGPSDMMKSVQNALLDNHVVEANIHLEYFVPPSKENPDDVATEGKSESDFNGEATIKILLDDEDIELQLNSSGDVILNAVLDKGLDAPYSCRGGVCTTCRAKLLEGKVHMDNNFALTDAEMEDGYILTCQSHPRSEVVSISYDD